MRKLIFTIGIFVFITGNALAGAFNDVTIVYKGKCKSLSGTQACYGMFGRTASIKNKNKERAIKVTVKHTCKGSAHHTYVVQAGEVKSIGCTADLKYEITGAQYLK